MRKSLTMIGNSMGIIIDKPILDLLGISRESEVEITTDGRRLIIEPAEETGDTVEVRKLSKKVLKTHSKTFQKLAE